MQIFINWHPLPAFLSVQRNEFITFQKSHPRPIKTAKKQQINLILP